MLAVSINKLSKTYNNKNVLKNISLDIEEGKIYGILGKNGAGKTTLLKIICGLTKISRGDIYVFGKVPTTGNNNINYLSENISLYLHLTAYENLKIIYLMEGKKVNKKEIYNVLEKVSLLHMHNKHVRTFSLGMKRRLQLAMVLCTNQKDLLILDEPTNGLDFDGMEWFKSTISSLRNTGTTIIMASHSINELENMITNYIIIDKGKIIKTSNWENKVSSKNRIGAIIYCTKEEQMQISGFNIAGMEILRQENDFIHIKTSLSYKKLNHLLTTNNIFPEDINIINNTLENIYKQSINGR